MERGLETVIPDDGDIQVFRNLERLLKKHRARLIGPEGQETEIPPKMYNTMVHFAHLLATNKVVLVTPMDKDLTTQEAAIYLGVSRPTLVKLLEGGEIPFTRAGKHRRIRFTDLKTYREKKYAERKRALDELTRMSEEMGGYHVSPEDLEAFNAA
jgi:excisionase family DNA binding protein